MPRKTQGWAVTNLLSCGQPSAREKILSGYVGFLARLRQSASWEVRILAEIECHDASSVTGTNIAEIKKEFGSALDTSLRVKCDKFLPGLFCEAQVI